MCEPLVDGAREADVLFVSYELDLRKLLAYKVGGRGVVHDDYVQIPFEQRLEASGNRSG
jgi:hypothetical protein